MDDGDEAGDDTTHLTEATEDGAPTTISATVQTPIGTRRRWRPFVAVLVVALAVGGAVAAFRWWTDPYRIPAPAPTVAGDQCGFGHAPGAVVAVDAATGALRWSRLVTPLDGDWADPPAGLALAGGSLVVFTTDGRIQALDAADGGHRWCSHGGLVSGVSDRLFTIRDDATVELDAATGRVTPVDQTVLTGLLEAAADPIAVRADPLPQRDDGVIMGRSLTATDRTTGAVLWERDVPGHQVLTTAELALVNDQSNGAYLLGRDDDFDTSTLTAYDLATGRPAWTRELPHYDALFLAGPDRAIVRHWRTGTVRLVDTTDGTTVWEVPHDNPGRSRRYSERGALTAVAADPANGLLHLLLVSSEPRRD